MKKTLLILLFAAVFNQAQACSCGFIPSFCEGVQAPYAKIGIFKIIANTLISDTMYVVLEESLFGDFEADTLKVVGQDGVNCNAFLDNFQVGESWVLSLYDREEANTKDLWGCFPSALLLQNGLVVGPIAPGVQSKPLAAFRNDLPACLALQPTGTELPFEIKMRIIPNPATDFVEVWANEVISSVQVFNALGQLLFERHAMEGEADFTLVATDKLLEGVYFLRVRFGSQTVVQQFLKL